MCSKSQPLVLQVSENEHFWEATVVVAKQPRHPLHYELSLDGHSRSVNRGVVSPRAGLGSTPSRIRVNRTREKMHAQLTVHCDGRLLYSSQKTLD
jgi:hypothetical protein